MHGRAIALLVTLVLGTTAFAGCVNVDPEAGVTPQNLALPDLLPRPDPLWLNPQDFPHPAYNFPTLTNPPNTTNGELPNKWYAPINATALPDHIEGMEHVAETQGEVPSGAGIALFGSLAIAPGFGKPTSVIDISDPTAPKVLSQLTTENGAHRGAAFIPFPNGTLIVVISTPRAIDVYDVTDPTAPVNVTSIMVKSHKLGVVPGTPIVYNANSAGGSDMAGSAGWVDPQAYSPATAKGKTEIYDLSNPWEPVLVQEFKNGYGCHHVYFWNNPAEDKYRAICAGLQMTQIWDTTDPLNPSVIVNVPVHHGVVGAPPVSVVPVLFSHFSILSQDGKVLIVGDESGGGGAPGCTGTGMGASGPLGNLWFYDVSNEKSPVLKGWIAPQQPAVSHPGNPTNCTAHHGRIVPDLEGHAMIVMGFYGAGVVLIDFTDPAMPRIVDQWAEGTNTWEAWYYNGYVFTGDMARGFDVLKFA